MTSKGKGPSWVYQYLKENISEAFADVFKVVENKTSVGLIKQSLEWRRTYLLWTASAVVNYHFKTYCAVQERMLLVVIYFYGRLRII